VNSGVVSPIDDLENVVALTARPQKGNDAGEGEREGMLLSTSTTCTANCWFTTHVTRGGEGTEDLASRGGAQQTCRYAST
jgi:hypothetical protein